MNTAETAAQTAVTPPQQPPAAAVVVAPKAREIRVVEDNSAIANLMDTSRFEHCYRIAGAMARASLIPKHLKGDSFEQTQANCFLVVNQSLRWGFDPFAVAPETYEVGGKLGFSGKLVAAVINTRGNLMKNLAFTFNDGKGDALEVTVSGHISGEDAPRTVTVSVAQARTENKMWTKDPHQKLIYTGATKWARRHMPEVVLGVMTEDDADQIKEEARFIAATPVKTPDFGPADGAPKRKALTEPAKTTEPAVKTVQEASTTAASQSEASKAPNAAPAPSGEQSQGKSEASEPVQVSGARQPIPFSPKVGFTDEYNNLLYMGAKVGITESEITKYVADNKLFKTGQTKLEELPTAKLQKISDSWETISQIILKGLQ